MVLAVGVSVLGAGRIFLGLKKSIFKKKSDLFKIFSSSKGGFGGQSQCASRRDFF